MSPTYAAPVRSLSSDVVEYCKARGLFDHLMLALQLAESIFAPVLRLEVEIEQDPETDEEAVVMVVAAALGVDEAVARKREYTRQWVASIPLEAIGRIRLLLDIN
jgi:hypothetical protein